MESTQLYRKGENPQLVNEFARYRRMRLYRGNAMFEVLTDKEVKTLGKLWCKEKLLISKLTKEDVLRLVDFAERVRKYREAF